MANFSDLSAVLEQLRMMRLFLERPSIQAQSLGIVIPTILAWGIAEGFWRSTNQRIRAMGERLPEQWRPSWKYGSALTHHLTFPVLCFLLTSGVVRLFVAQGWRSALIAELRSLFWFLLGYRLIVAILDLLLGHEYMARYQPRLLTPLFALFMLNRVLAYVININVLTRFVVFKPFDHPVTLGSVIIAPLTLYFLFFTSRAIQDMLQDIVVPKTGSDPEIIHAVLTLSRYIVIAIGIIIIAASLGVNMATVAVISGGLSVGIGFGLQQIVANFLSGILLLFERTLRPGDVIDVNGEMGVVETLSIRATTMRTANNVRIIVPNESLLNASVKTYTKRNRFVRIVVPVGVSYSSCPEDVRDLLLAVAQEHPAIRKEPKPMVFFKEFGESSIDFQLMVWIDDPLKTVLVSSELRYLIWDALAQHHIEIPFPQRDLHLRSGIPWEQIVPPSPRASSP